MADEIRIPDVGDRDRMVVDQFKALTAIIAVRGQEIAKLAKRVYHQRLVIREMRGHITTATTEVRIMAEDIARQNRILKDQNMKLTIENRGLRLLLINYRPNID